MTVEELIAALEECDPNAEVRVALQPTYPLLADLNSVTSTKYLREECAEDIDFEDGDCDLDDSDLEKNEVYLCASDAREHGARNYWEHPITV